MHSRHWTGYLRKLGCEPTLLSDYFHQLGKNAMYLIHMQCEQSRDILKNRFGKIVDCHLPLIEQIRAWALQSIYSGLTWIAEFQNISKEAQNHLIKLDGFTIFD